VNIDIEFTRGMPEINALYMMTQKNSAIGHWSEKGVKYFTVLCRDTLKGHSGAD